MNAVVETTETPRTVYETTHRVTIGLSEDEATLVKLALEMLRSPASWSYEAHQARINDHSTMDDLVKVLERAGVYVDGVYE